LLAAKMIWRRSITWTMVLGLSALIDLTGLPTCASNGHARFRVTENPERRG
jgi:hypothetical protein